MESDHVDAPAAEPATPRCAACGAPLAPPGTLSSTPAAMRVEADAAVTDMMASFLSGHHGQEDTVGALVGLLVAHGILPAAEVAREFRRRGETAAASGDGGLALVLGDLAAQAEIYDPRQPAAAPRSAPVLELVRRAAPLPDRPPDDEPSPPAAA
jgi:hypothetical protein